MNARAESLRYYERAAARHLEMIGVTREDVRNGIPSDKMQVPNLRYEIWLWDSVAEACKLFARGERDDNVIGLRCLLQICDYAGRLGGWPTSTASDAYIVLRNTAEDLLRDTARVTP